MTRGMQCPWCQDEVENMFLPKHVSNQHWEMTCVSEYVGLEDWSRWCMWVCPFCMLYFSYYGSDHFAVAWSQHIERCTKYRLALISKGKCRA